MTVVDPAGVAFTGEVHPAAVVWPLLPDDELVAMAHRGRTFAASGGLKEAHR